MTALSRGVAEAFPIRGRGPQGLRRPRFSFFRFTCQTARNLAAPSSALRLSLALTPRLGARETREKPPKPAHPTWPWAGRMIHRANSEGLLKARHRIKRRRAKRTYIGFGRGHCQRLRTQNTRENASRIEQLKYRPGSHLWRRFYGHSHSARRTTATFLRRPLPHRVGSVAMRGRDDCQLSFGVPSGSAVLPVAITIGSR